MLTFVALIPVGTLSDILQLEPLWIGPETAPVEPSSMSLRPWSPTGLHNRATLLLLLRIAFATWPCAAATAETLASANQTVREAGTVIPIEWLGDTILIEQAEAAHPGIADDRVARFPAAGRPFGFQNAEWEALKARMKPGDDLRTFSSPEDSWQHLAGRAGIALLRDGQVIDTIVTVMN